MRCILITPELAFPVSPLPCQVINCAPGCLSQQLPYSVGYRSRVPTLCPSVLADSAAPLPGWDFMPSQRTYCNRTPTWASAFDHRFPISCDPALSFLPKPHHPTWLYPPLSCLGYRVWKPHKHHPLPDCHHASLYLHLLNQTSPRPQSRPRDDITPTLQLDLDSEKAATCGLPFVLYHPHTAFKQVLRRQCVSPASN